MTRRSADAGREQPKGGNFDLVSMAGLLIPVWLPLGDGLGGGGSVACLVRAVCGAVRVACGARVAWCVAECHRPECGACGVRCGACGVRCLGCSLAGVSAGGWCIVGLSGACGGRCRVAWAWPVSGVAGYRACPPSSYVSVPRYRLSAVRRVGCPVLSGRCALRCPAWPVAGVGHVGVGLSGGRCRVSGGRVGRGRCRAARPSR